MRMILIIGTVILAWAATPASAAPLNAGLSDTLPSNVLRAQGFVEFEQASRIPIAPIAFSLTYDGRPLTSAAQVREFFQEKFFASLPDQTQIQVSTGTDAREIWNYPVGTRVAHSILLKTRAAPIFELRISEKLPNGTWAMGSYSPPDLQETTDAPLILNQYAATPELRIRIRPIQESAEGELRLRRINLQSCRGCHANTSPSAYQFQSSSDAGTCGFGPANPSLMQDWARRYQQARGHQPFARR